MSAVTSRPRESGISVAAAAGAFTAGVGIAGLLLRGASAAVQTAARAAARALEDEVDGCLESLPQLQAAQRKRLEALAPMLARLEPPEGIRLEAAVCLGGLALSPDSTLESLAATLEMAGTPVEARHACDALLERAAHAHQELFTRRLVEACTRASSAAGFPTVEVRHVASGVRLLATNPAGQALVTEIETGPAAEPALATEVVGVRDGSCSALLDRFDAALAQEGVHSAAPRRRFTGGVCALAAAREYALRLARAEQHALEVPEAPSTERRASGRGALRAAGSR